MELRPGQSIQAGGYKTSNGLDDCAWRRHSSVSRTCECSETSPSQKITPPYRYICPRTASTTGWLQPVIQSSKRHLAPLPESPPHARCTQPVVACSGRL